LSAFSKEDMHEIKQTYRQYNGPKNQNVFLALHTALNDIKKQCPKSTSHTLS